MSRSRTRRKPIRVSIPAINLGLLGDRSLDEARTKVEEKQEELAVIRLDADIVRERQRRDRLEAGEEPVATETKDPLGSQLMKEVVIPMVNRNLEQPAVSRGTDSVAEAAIKLADKALDKERGRDPQKASTLTEVINSLDSLKNFLGKDESTIRELNEIKEKLKEIEKGGKEGDEYSTLDNMFNLIERIEKRFQPASGGSSDKFYDFEKWKVGFDRKTTMQDRAWHLRLRQQDKAHDIAIAQLGVDRERTEMFRDTLKTMGKAVVEGLTDEDLEEEEAPRMKPTGKGRIWRGKCTKCGKPVMVPPEGQVAGKEFSCSCGAVFEWFDE